MFDCITMVDVIEHLKYPDRVLKTIRNVLKNNGIIIISTPIFVPNLEISNLHYKEYAKDELDLLMKQNGYKKVDYKIIDYGNRETIVAKFIKG